MILNVSCMVLNRPCCCSCRAAELPQASLHLAPGAEGRELHECCKYSFQRCLKINGVFGEGIHACEPTGSDMLCLFKKSCTMKHNHTEFTCARREVTQGTRPALGSPHCSNWPTPKPTSQEWTSYILSPWCVSSQFSPSFYPYKCARWVYSFNW